MPGVVLDLRRDVVPAIVPRFESSAATQCIDRLEATGRHQPGPRIGRQALARPLLQRGPEGLVQRFLGEVEVAEQADQRRQYRARLAAVDGIDLVRADAHAAAPRRGGQRHQLNTTSARKAL